MDLSDDGRIRTGTFWSALSHAFTAVVGSGILAVPWSMAQLGWILGPIVMIIFAVIAYYTANLLSECYRVDDSNHGKRNYTYNEAVRSFLGEKKMRLCGAFQYLMLWGTMVGYTVTSAVSIRSVVKSICKHKKLKGTKWETSGYVYMLLYGGVQIMLSQFPNLERVTFLSATAAITSVGYSVIALGLVVSKLAINHELRGSIRLGVPTSSSKDIASSSPVWNVFQSLGNIAFAYTYSMLLLEIQDTLKIAPEIKTMRRVTEWAIGGTTVFYMALACIGFAAFGHDVPGNILTADYNPFWVVDIGNIAVIIHLVTAYQVFAQPLYCAGEKWLASKYPTTPFFNKSYTMRPPFTQKIIEYAPSRLLLRTLTVVITTSIAMCIPFFNAILGLLGALSFWPLTIYFPVNMYMVQARVKKGSLTFMFLKAMNFVCLPVTLMAAIGSIAQIVENLKGAKLFGNKL